MLTPPDPVPEIHTMSDPPQSVHLLPSRLNVVRDIVVDSLIWVIVMFGFGIAIGIIGIMAGVSINVLRSGHFGNADPWVSAAGSLIGDFALAGVGLRRLRLNREKGRQILNLFQGGVSRAIILGVILGAMLTLVSVAYSTFIRNVLGHHALPSFVRELRVAQGDKPLFVVILFRNALLAPVCEEFFFRAIIFGSSWTIGRPWLGAGAGSVLFAMAHVDAFYFVYHFCFGMTMCWLFMRSRTLTTPIATHMTINILACAMALW
jgi:membrane protease YdiL (CAAX protease family)